MYGGIAELSALDPAFAPKVQALLASLTAQGFQPRIASGWRSLDEQKALKAQGYSQVDFSFHNAVDAQGRPAALAVDVVDRRYSYSNSADAARFFKALGATAKSLGLSWGGDWKQSDPHWAPYGLGWDPSHVQLYDNSALSKIRNRAEQTMAALSRGQVSTALTTATRGMPSWLLASAGVFGILSVFLVILRLRRRAS